MRRIGYELLGVAVLFAGGRAGADSKQKEMEAYVKAGQPGPQHKLLASMAGSWELAAKFWPAPGQPPLGWSGTAERKMILGGRYLEEHVTGSFGGQSFHGLRINGYDNVQDKYVGSWVDSMSTGMPHGVGTADATGKVITYEREAFDPLTRAKSKSREVLRVINDDKGVLEFYKKLPDGKEYKMMELVYTRKGK